MLHHDAAISWQGWQEFTTKSTKATKGDENVYEDSFVLFVSFVVKLIFGCGRRLRCVLCALCGERLLLTGRFRELLQHNFEENSHFIKTAADGDNRVY